MNTALPFRTALLSGTLTLAGGCVGTPSPKTEGLDSDCPVFAMPPVTVSRIPELDQTITFLANRGVESDTFHRESEDPFQSLTPKCSQREKALYGQFQAGLADKVASLSPGEIRAHLEGLYREAYAFDEGSGEMKQGETQAHQRTKRRLDLWLAALDYRALEDGDFLNRLWEEGAIRAVANLNSLAMSAADRGAFEKFRRFVEGKGDEAALRGIHADGYRRMFKWFRSYDGRDHYSETPFYRSGAELIAAGRAYFGEEEFSRLNISAFPREVFESLVNEAGEFRRYRDLQGRATERLLDDLHGVLMGIGSAARPNTAKTAVREIFLISGILHERGLDAEKHLQQRIVRDFASRGIPEEDLQLLFRTQNPGVKYTANRLDDYRARYDFLDVYRDVYSFIVNRPPAEVFSPKTMVRYSLWGNFMMNRSQSGVYVRLSELDAIRKEVRAGSPPAFSQDGFAFAPKDLERSDWFRPSDLGFCGQPGSMDKLASLPLQGQTAGALICDNVEMIASLPPWLMPSHVVGTALGVFGIIAVTNAGYAPLVDWTPGLFLGVVSHEAGHVQWFRKNFDHQPERLAMQGPNERNAYAIGSEAVKSYLQADPSAKSDPLEEFLKQSEGTVRLANERLGLQSDDMDPKAWNAEWDRQPLSKLVFQPADLYSEQMEKEFASKLPDTKTPGEFQTMGGKLLERAIEIHVKDKAEREEALRALKGLTSEKNGPSGNEDGVLLTASHPFTRAYNGFASLLGQEPVFLIDEDRQGWLRVQENLARKFFIATSGLF